MSRRGPLMYSLRIADDYLPTDCSSAQIGDILSENLRE